MRYKQARNTIAAGIAAVLVATVGPTAADAAVHFGAGAPTSTTDSHWANCENPDEARKCPMWVNRIHRIEY